MLSREQKVWRAGIVALTFRSYLGLEKAPMLSRALGATPAKRPPNPRKRDVDRVPAPGSTNMTLSMFV